MSNEQKNDGGSAFPRSGTNMQGKLVTTAKGMTLRDYFAAAAMQGLMADPSCSWPSSEIAQAAWVVADAMIAERAK